MAPNDGRTLGDFIHSFRRWSHVCLRLSGLKLCQGGARGLWNYDSHAYLSDPGWLWLYRRRICPRFPSTIPSQQ